MENKTVVTDPHKGAVNNRWIPVLESFQLPFIALPEVPWKVYEFKSPLLRLNEIFPDGIEIPEMYVGKQILPRSRRTDTPPPPAPSRTPSVAFSRRSGTTRTSTSTR